MTNQVNVQELFDNKLAPVIHQAYPQVPLPKFTVNDYTLDDQTGYAEEENTLFFFPDDILPSIKQNVSTEHALAFVLLHELGHWWYHKVAHGKTTESEMVMYMLEGMGLGDDHTAIPQEHNADLFAAKWVNKIYSTSYQTREELFERN